MGAETLYATRSHMFWVESEGKWIEAAKLKVGMSVRLQDGRLSKILTVVVNQLQQPETTYNLVVDRLHNYYVGNGRILVHNGDGSYTNTHQSGMQYVGKGDMPRAIESAGEKAAAYDDPVVDIDWTPANGTADSFVQEEMRMRIAGGPGNNTYNKINSPGNKIAAANGCP